MQELDVAVIGGGTAGLNARRAALAQGASVTVFDPGPLGTTCARVGCMPSKLLIAAAELAHDAARGPDFGVQTTVEIDPVAVMRRVRQMRDLFVSRTKQGIDRLGAPIPHRVRFTGPDRFEAGGEEYRARAIVLAPGSTPVVPAPWNRLGAAVITTDALFELERLPSSLLVIGAGAIGLELGQAMHRLGVRVTVLDVAGRLAGLREAHHVDVLREALGIDLHLRHELLDVEAVAEGIAVGFRGEDGAERHETWDKVLVAAGRRPRLSGLGLDAAGLEPLPDVDPETGRVGATNLYLAGDVTGARMLLHEAAHEGRIAGANAARHPNPRPEARKTPLALVFTNPQVALVGRRGDATGSLDFAFQSRARVLGRNAGRLEVYARRDGRLTGATIIGPDAEHLGHLVAWAVQAGLTVDQALDMPFYHPVLEEGLEAALKDLRDRLAALAAA